MIDSVAPPFFNFHRLAHPIVLRRTTSKPCYTGYTHHAWINITVIRNQCRISSDRIFLRLCAESFALRGFLTEILTGTTSTHKLPTFLLSYGTQILHDYSRSNYETKRDIAREVKIVSPGMQISSSLPMMTTKRPRVWQHFSMFSIQLVQR
jgi:hypothetical protein